MRLTEKDFYMLSLMGALKFPKDRSKGKVSELVHSFLDLREQIKPQSWSEEDLLSFLTELLGNDRLGQLELLERCTLNEVEAFLFENREMASAEQASTNDAFRVITFSYNAENQMMGLSYLFDEKASIHHQLTDFIEKNSGESMCYVNGYAVGGSFALYTAAKAEGLTGVVFDAPGVGQLLSDEEKQKLQVKNVFAFNSLVSAIGEHPEQIIFAQKGSGKEDDLLAEGSWRERFSFDKNGNITIGEQGEAYLLFSKLNKVMEGDSSVLEDVLQAFADTVGMEDFISEHVSLAFLMILERLEENHLRRAMFDVEKAFEQRVQEQVSACRKGLADLTKMDASIEDVQSEMVHLVEKTMIETGELAGEFYQCVEAVLSCFVVYSIDKNTTEEMDHVLERFIEGLDEKMNKLPDQLSLEIEKDMEEYLDSLLRFPEFKLDF